MATLYRRDSTSLIRHVPHGAFHFKHHEKKDKWKNTQWHRKKRSICVAASDQAFNEIFPITNKLRSVAILSLTIYPFDQREDGKKRRGTRYTEESGAWGSV